MRIIRANVMVARAYLEEMGHSVTVANNGREALDALEDGDFDLILMDVHMPVMDGCQATTNIRAASPLVSDIPIIGMTASADPSTIESCLEAGMNEVITKPIHRDSFGRTVCHWLRDRTPGVFPPLLSPDDEVGDTANENLNTPMDYERALREFGGNEALLKNVLQVFLSNVESQIGVMESAIADSRPELLKNQAHSIKGGAANLYAYALAVTASELEGIGLSGDLEGAGEVFSAWLQAFRDFRDFLSEKFPALGQRRGKIA